MASVSPSPSSTIQRPDIGMAIGEWDNAMTAAGYIAPLVLPVQEVMESSGNYGRWSFEELAKNVDSVLRAAGAAYPEVDFKFGQDNYETQEYGLQVAIDERFKQKFAYAIGGNPAAFDFIGAALIRRIILQKQEERVRDLVDMGSAAVATLTESAVTTDWTNHSTATPSEDLRTAIEVVKAACGRMPTDLVLTGKAFRHLKQNDDFIDRIKYSGHADPTTRAISADDVARYLDLERVIITEAMTNTANEGQTFSAASMWNDDRGLLFIRSQPMSAGNPMGAPGLGRTMHWGKDGSQAGGTVEEYMSDERRSRMIRVRHDVDEKLEVTETAVVMTGLLT